MDKEQLKESIKTLAEEQGITLPKGWGNKSDENLRILLDELQNEEFEAEIETEEAGQVDGVVSTSEKEAGPKQEVKVKVGEKTLSIVDMKRLNKSMLKQLQDEEYVDIEIEPNEMYPEGSTVPIGLNGVVFRVPVGILFEKGVPKSIKAVYDYSKRETREANNKLKKKLTGEIKVQ